MDSDEEYFDIKDDNSLSILVKDTNTYNEHEQSDDSSDEDEA